MLSPTKILLTPVYSPDTLFGTVSFFGLMDILGDGFTEKSV